MPDARRTVEVVEIRWGSVSITGNYRDNNEDRCLADSDARYFLVADGMGGQAAGEKASEMAVELIPQKLEQLIDFDNENAEAKSVSRGIDEAVGYANLEIMALGEVDPDFHSMGTTIAFIVNAGGKFYVGGVGDSRVYRCREGSLEQLTTDHSLTQALVDAGTIKPEDAPTHRYRNVLYRYLGTKEGGTGTEATVLEPAGGERFLLCSDGVTDSLDEQRLAEMLSRHKEPQAAAEEIVHTAEAEGSKDNITCVVVFVG